GEYRDVVVAGEAYQPSLAARLLTQGAQSEAWIPGQVESGVPLPLSPQELEELYRTNATVTGEDEREIDTRLPAPDTLSRPEAFARLVSDEMQLQASDRMTGAKYWR